METKNNLEEVFERDIKLKKQKVTFPLMKIICPS